MFLVILLEGYDLIVYGTALPILTEEWGIHSAEAGMIVSPGLFGMVFGAVLLGIMADWHGRKFGCIFGPVIGGWLLSVALPVEVNFFAFALPGIIAAVVLMMVPAQRSYSGNKAGRDRGELQENA